MNMPDMNLRAVSTVFSGASVNILMPGSRIMAIVMALAIAACSGLPTPTFSTTTGCGLAQWNEAWARENIASVTWDGICKEGLTQGNGTLVATMKSGNPMRFTGQMSNGKLKEGTFLRTDGWELSGDFVDGFFYKGTILRPGGDRFYEGTMILYQKQPGGGFIGYSDQRFDQGKLYLSDGSYVEDGRWDGSLGMYVLTLDAIRAARGVVWGKYYDANGVLQYRIVGGRRYADDTSFARAKDEYVKREAIATEQANQAYMAEQQRKEAEDRRQAMAALTSTLGAMAAGNNRTNTSANLAPSPASPTVSSPSAISRATTAGSGSTSVSKRSNVPEANASHCLAPQKEGGVLNKCAYAIEYSYCVVAPKPGSWAASFDCNQGKSGSWQVGPNSRAIMQTAGQQVAFFGCRYGPTLSRPDGISPADFRYNPNGLPSGRCREWGAK